MRAEGAARAELLEREAEGHRLELAVSQATDGHPGLLVVDGAAGIGKTRLLDELRDLGLAMGMAVRWSRGTALEQTLAWSVVRQLLTQPVLDLRPGERDRVLERAAARAAAVLGLGEEAARPLQFSEALHALYWLTVKLSERTPLLLIVDDVQWADRESIGYLSYLGNRLEDQRVLLAVAIRTGEPEGHRPELDELRLVPDQITLSLSPLSRLASGQVVGRLLGEEAQPEVCQLFHDLTGGNPFLLHELCRGFDRNGSVTADAVEQATTTAAQRVSMSVGARLTRYPRLAAEVAEAVSVLGGSSTVHRLSGLTGATHSEVAGAIEQLIEAEILEQADRAVEFVHPLVRRAVYERLGWAECQVRHARAAEILRHEAPAQEVASQLLRALPAGEAWRVACLRQAASDALAVGAPEAASGYLRRALSEPPPQDELYDLLLELGGSELHHDPNGAVTHLAQALGRANSPELRSSTALALARAYALLGYFTSGLEVLNRAVDELGDSHSSQRRQLDSSRLVFARWDYASQELRHELFSDLRARAESGAELDRDERANLAHELAARGEGLDTAAECARWAIRHSATVSGTDAAFVLQLTSVLVLCDLCQEADEIAQHAAREAESRGSDVDACAALTLGTYCALRRGDMWEAVDRAQSALALGTGIWDTAAVAWCSEALAERGEIASARSLVRQYGFDELTPTDRASLGYQHAVLLHHTARMRALAGDLTRALDDFRQVGELAEGWAIGNPAVLDWRSSAASILLAMDRPDEASELAQQELTLARRWGTASAVGTALRAVGMAEPGSDGLALLREAVDVHAGGPGRLEYARSLVALGVRLRRQRQHLEARESLRKGLDLASRCGGALLANKARDELVAAGGKPRRDAIEGVEALTGRERRIAELAVEGLTNRQIAQQLFLSPRTVEHHLRHIYRKLGILGRDELAGALHSG